MKWLQHRVANCILALSFIAGVTARKAVDCARLGCSLSAAALVSTRAICLPSFIDAVAGVADS